MSGVGNYQKYAVVQAPFMTRTDIPPASLEQGENLVVMQCCFEHNKSIVAPTSSNVTTFSDNVVSGFALKFAATAETNIIFTETNMYYSTVATAVTEITVAGGSTDISADSGTENNKFSLTVVNGIVYFAHDGLGPLRKWDPSSPANYSDVAAPGSGWHNGVKLKPKYLTALNNRLICGADTSAPGSPYDVAWSAVGAPEDFASFGSGHTTLIDTPDGVANLSTLYGKLIVYKFDSIVVGTLTGDSVTPFSFERYQQGAQASIGVFQPYSLAGDGSVDYFLSRSGFMAFNGSQLSSIGKGADALGLRSISSSDVVQGVIITNLYADSSTNNNVKAYVVAASYVSAGTFGNTNFQPLFYNVTTGAWSVLHLNPTYNTSSSVPIATTFNVSGITSGFTMDTGPNLRSPATARTFGWGGSSGSFNNLLGVDNNGSKMSGASTPTTRFVLPPTIYEGSGILQKTIMRIGIEFSEGPGKSTGAISGTYRIYSENGRGTSTTPTGFWAATTNDNALGDVSPYGQARFGWINTTPTTAREPMIELQFDKWYYFSRIIVEYTLGGEQ